LLLLQAFMGVAAVMTLILVAAVSERKRIEAQLRRLTVSDALTGLGNYRQLATVLEAEIRRSQRTARQFAVVFLDVDGLKEINDRHGHVVGSRALSRVAEVLHSACRAVDTAARFGGDEFALVLPEADHAAAERVVRRIVERLAQDIERPRVATSLGVAVYPVDGETVEALLGAADRVLYKMKARPRSPTP
jgi:diguanylate cyclase (GGDEF)-like protein